MFDKIKLWAKSRRYGAKRETLAYPKLLSLMGQARSMGNPKPTPTNLRYFSRTPYARKAINTIKSSLTGMEWRLVGKNETLQRCLQYPNQSDNFNSLMEQMVEDMLVVGACAVEIGYGDKERPLWLWPVDSTTITPLAEWDGNPDAIRFYQTQSGASSSFTLTDGKPLAARKLMYVRINDATDSPYGYSPLEIAFNSVQRQLAASLYAANVASNAQPNNMVYVGDATEEEVLKFRNYWRNEVEGQGQTPILGNQLRPEVIRLHLGNDEALYLKWQTFVIREIATAFGVSPQNMGLESDVNRSTAEVSQDRDLDTVIRPMARKIEAHMNQLLAPFGERFEFTGLNREDELATAQIYQIYYTNNLITPNEQRLRLGMDRSADPLSDVLFANSVAP